MAMRATRLPACAHGSVSAAAGARPAAVRPLLRVGAGNAVRPAPATRGRRAPTAAPRAVLSTSQAGPAVRPPPREAVLCRRLSTATPTTSAPDAAAAADAPAPAGGPAHAAAVTSLLVLVDQADAKVIASGSMDKTVALWSLTAAEGPLCGTTGSTATAAATDAAAPCSHPPSAQPVARLVVPAAGSAAPPEAGGEDAGAVEDGTLSVASSSSQAASPAASEAPPPPPPSESGAAGAPVFALAADLEHCSARAAALASMDGGPTAAARAARPTVFIGSAGRAVAAWEPPDAALLPGVALGGHDGWVRALCAAGRWLFSCGCGGLRQWDLSRAVPRLVGEASLGDTGDVSALACGGGMVYAGGTDGSLRAWAVSPDAGGLPPAPAASAPRGQSHAGRVTSIVCPPGSRYVYSTSHDGSVRAWHAKTLAPAASAPGAHGGGRVRCAALAGDGLLYTGGDDGLVRRWSIDGGGAYDGAAGEGADGGADCAEAAPGAPRSAECFEAALLQAAAAGGGGGGGGSGGSGGRGPVVAAAAVAAASTTAPPPPSSPLVPSPAGALYGHSHPVRALAAGPLDTLVSGDKGGEVLVWRV